MTSSTVAARRLSAQRSRSLAGGASRRRDVVDVRVQDVEAVRVPELEQELAQRLADGLDAEQVAVPRLLGRQEVPAEGVRAVAVDDVPRHDDVAERLRHLLALGIGDVAEAEDGLVRATGRTAASRSRSGCRTSRASGRSPRRCSRPGTALRTCRSSRTARATGRTASSRSRTRRRSPRGRGAAARRRSATGSRRRRRTGGADRSICDAGDARAAPRRSRCRRPRPPRCARPAAACPSSARATSAQSTLFSSQSPDAPVLDVLRVPLDGLVGRQQPVAQLRGADVPGRLGVVDQRRVAAPAVRVRVQEALGVAQEAA